MHSEKLTMIHVEDCYEMRKSYEEYMNRIDFVEALGVYANAEETLDELTRFSKQGKRLDIAFVDLVLDHNAIIKGLANQMGGPALCQRIKKVCPEAKVAFFSIFSEESYLFAAARANPNAYLLKTKHVDFKGYKDAVNIVKSNELYCDPEVEEIFREFLRVSDIKFNETEMKVLEICRKGDVGDAAIAKGLFVSPHTAKGYVASILTKIRQYEEELLYQNYLPSVESNDDRKDKRKHDRSKLTYYSNLLRFFTRKS